MRAKNEESLRVRLAALFGREFPRWLPVDVVDYAGPDGGSIVLNPHHLAISASSSGPAALEALFRKRPMAEAVKDLVGALPAESR